MPPLGQSGAPKSPPSVSSPDPWVLPRWTRFQYEAAMAEHQGTDQRCRWEMLVAHQWERCSKPRRHEGAHQLGGVTIGRRAIVRLRLQRQPSVRRAKARD